MVNIISSSEKGSGYELDVISKEDIGSLIGCLSPIDKDSINELASEEIGIIINIKEMIIYLFIMASIQLYN